MAHRRSPEIIAGTGALTVGAFLVNLVLAERRATDEERAKLNPEAVVDSHIRDGDNAVYIVPGCRANGHYIGQMFEQHVEHLGSTHHLAYPEIGFSLESVKHELLKARKLDEGRPAVVYVSSMGGMVICSLLQDPEFREKFGKIETLILDSSPADSEDLDTHTRLLMFLVENIPTSRTVSKVYRNIMRAAAKKVMPHSPSVTKEQVLGHARTSADTPLAAVEGQAFFIDSTWFKDGQLADAVRDIDNIWFVGASHDNMVNLDAAYGKWCRAMGCTVLRATDPDRNAGGHASGPEFVDGVVKLMKPTQKEVVEVPKSTPPKETVYDFDDTSIFLVHQAA